MKSRRAIIALILLTAAFFAWWLARPGADPSPRGEQVIAGEPAKLAPVQPSSPTKPLTPQADQPSSPQPTPAPHGVSPAVASPNTEPRIAAAPVVKPLARLLAAAETLASAPAAPGAGGASRARLVRVEGFKHKLLRVEETLGIDPVTGIETVVKQTAMAADQVTVVLEPGASDAALASEVAALGGRVSRKLRVPGAFVISFVSPALDTVPTAVAALAALPSVRSVSPNHIVYALDTLPNDTDFGQLYGLHNTGQDSGTVDADIDAPAAWDIEKGSAAIVVGIIDTGIDYTHPDLAANIWTNPGESGAGKETNGIDDDGNGYIDDVHGWDYANNDNDPMDDQSHGSHCAGTIGGVGNNGVGVTGVNWTTRLMALKFLNKDGFGDESDAADAVSYATEMGARLTSNSWGGGTANLVLELAINAAATDGCLFIAAAGNSPVNIDEPANSTYPAAFDSDAIITVAATDRKDARAWFTSYGPTKVDLGAPGVDILSTIPGNQYGLKSGTSMATPHVAGAVALVWSHNPTFSAAQIKAAILTGTEPVASLQGKCVTGGRLNVFNALNALDMYVFASNPAVSSVLTTTPVSFQITFTDDVVPGSVQAADFTVNGIAADSFTLNTPRVVTFTFNTTPVSAEGTQTMHIATDSITRTSDGRGILAWTGEFRYDVLRLAVTATTPANGATAPLPLTEITLQFNEEILASSLDPADLRLNQGEAVSVVRATPASATFTVSGLTNEGILSIMIAPGAITDIHGNPCLAYAGSITLDFGDDGSTGGMAFVGKIAAKLPEGSLVHHSKWSGGIAPASDTDIFKFTMDAGQTLAAVITPATGTLRAVVDLRDASNTVLATATASAAGQPAILQPVQLSAAGVYSIVVRSSAGTSGNYTLKPVINAAVNVVGIDSFANALDISSSFITPATGIARGAAVGEGSNDWFRFPMVAGDRLAVASHRATAFELYDPSGNLVAASVAGRPLHAAIDDFSAAASGDYRLRVTASQGEYTIVLTRNAAFDLERNNSAAEAQILDGRSRVLGGLGDNRLYAVEWSYTSPVRIHEIDPSTGQATFLFNSPPMTPTNPFGLNLAFDGEFLWFNAGAFFGGVVDGRKLYKLEPLTGELLETITMDPAQWANDDIPYGLAYAGGEICVSAFRNIHWYQKEPWAYASSIETTWTEHGLAGDDINGRLYAFSQRDGLLKKIDSANGALLGTGPMDTSFGNAQGMAVVGSEIAVSETVGDGLGSAIAFYDPETLAFQRRVTVSGMTTQIGGLAGDGTGGGPDWFAFEAAAGDNLVIETATPAGDHTAPALPANTLDPALQLYGPGGTLIGSDDNSSTDGRNARLTHAAIATGIYKIRIAPQGRTRGNYALSVTGATGGTAPAFTATATEPADASFLPGVPGTLTVHFSRPILLSSLQASDLLIDGVPATGFTVIDGRTIVFTLPVLTEGARTATIAAGAVLDSTGNPLGAFTSSFSIDLTAPRVTATSVAEGGAIPTGNLTLTFQISEPLRSANIDADVLALSGAATGAKSPASVTYSAPGGTPTVTAVFNNLPADGFTLTLKSGNGLCEDRAGNDLDGAPSSPLPSGDGAAGGDFTLRFFTQIPGAVNLPAFTPASPRGSMVHVSTINGYSGPAGDADVFTTVLDAGQTLSVAVKSTTGTLQPSVSVAAPDASLLGSATATAAGQPAVLQTLPVASAGTYSITVTGASGTIGGFTLDAVLNGAAEPERAGGAANDTPATAQSLDAAFQALTGSARRAAILGSGDNPLGPDGSQYRAVPVAYAFEDILTTGTKIPNSGNGYSDDAFELTPALLGGFTFPFYGTNYDRLWASSNGLITFGSGYTAYTNGKFSGSSSYDPTQASIAVLWEDLMARGRFNYLEQNSGIYYKVVGAAPNRRLIIQWQHFCFIEVPATESNLIFQAVLSEADGSIELRYQNLNCDFVYNVGDPASWDEGRNSTVGIKAAGAQSEASSANRLMVQYPNRWFYSNPQESYYSSYVSSYKALKIANNFPAGYGTDCHNFTVAAGERITLAASGAGGAAVAALQLLDPAGTLVATGAPATNAGAAVPNFLATASGVYTARITHSLGADYALAVHRNAAFDLEPNDSRATANALDGRPAATGHLASGTDVDYFSFTATTGQTITIETTTPGGGAGEFANPLDPSLEIYNPSGNSIATDNNNAGDGRNARIVLAAPVSGTYTVAVRAQSSTSGEYVLSTNMTLMPPVASSIVVNPATATVPVGGTQAFSATVLDQYGTPLDPQPAVIWSATGAGTVNATGLFTAGASNGSATVTASASGISGNATVTVTNTAPTVTITGPNLDAISLPDRTDSLVLTATATDAEVTPTVTWSQVSGPGTTTFSNASSSSTSATFSANGTYVLRVTASDGLLTVTDEVTVGVETAIGGVGPAKVVQLDLSDVAAPSVAQIGSSGYWVTVDGESSAKGDVADLKDSANAATGISLKWTNLSSFQNATRGEGGTGSSATAADGLSTWTAAASTGDANSGVTFTDGGKYFPWSVVRSYCADNTSGSPLMALTLASATPRSYTFWVMSSYDHNNPVAPNFRGLFNVGGTYASGSFTGGTTLTLDAPKQQAATDSLLDSNETAPGSVKYHAGKLATQSSTYNATSGKYEITLQAGAATATTAGVYLNGLIIQSAEITNAGEAPRVNPGTAPAATAGLAASLSGTASDDGGTPTVTWSLVSGPGTATFANANAAITSLTFSAPGNYVLRLSATDGTATVHEDLTVTVTGETFASWISGYNVGGLTAATDDPDRDGLANLIEYALGTDPSDPSDRSDLTVGISGNHLTLTFTPQRLTGLTYVVQAGSDLVTWADTPLTGLTVGVPYTHTDSTPLAGATKRFIRLKITQP